MGSAVNLIRKNGSVAQESLGNPALEDDVVPGVFVQKDSIDLHGARPSI